MVTYENRNTYIELFRVKLYAGYDIGINIACDFYTKSYVVTIIT